MRHFRKASPAAGTMHAMLIDGNLAEIATAAAVLVVEQGLEYGPARHRALKVLGLPSRTTLPNLDAVDRAVREHLALFGAESQPAELAEMRSVALQWMERLAEFRPHLTGTVLAGTATRQSDICIQLYCDDPKSAEIALINWGIAYDTQTIRGFTGEPVDALSFVQFCSGLKAEVGVHLLIYDYDDLRASRRGRSTALPFRADLQLLRAILKDVKPGAAHVGA